MIERGADPGPADAAQGDKRKASAARAAANLNNKTIGISEAAPAGRPFLRLGAARPRAGGMIDAGRFWYRKLAGTIGPGCILYQSVFGVC